jgi:polygalacturonase
MGSEISGGVRNVFADNNVMSSPDLERGIRIKTNAVRGGVLENIYIRNTTIGEVREAIVIDFYYEEGDAGKFDPTVRNIQISNLTCQHASKAFSIRGFERAPVSDLRLVNVKISKADQIGLIQNVENLQLDAVTINDEPFKR